MVRRMMPLIWLQIIDHVLWIDLVSDNIRWWSCDKPIAPSMSFLWYVEVKPEVKCKCTTTFKCQKPTIYLIICIIARLQKAIFLWQEFQASSVIFAEFGLWISPSYSSWQTACCSVSVCPKPADFLRFPSAGRHYTPCRRTAGTREIGKARTAPLSYGL